MEEEKKNTELEQPPSDQVIRAGLNDLNDPNDNMEVHHHTHAGHEKKTWKAYFWEFLMLFLAVFCGFLAENIREHTVEKQRAKELAQSMLEDLKKDTAALHSAITFSYKKLSACDSNLALLHKPRDQWNDTSLYKNMAPLLTSYPFTSTDGTYTQMKTSGSLRYFKQSLVNDLNAYAVQLKKTAYRDDVEDKGTWLLGPFNINKLNLEVLGDLRFNRPITHELYIKIADKNTTDELINLVVMIKNFRTRSLMEYQEQLKIADNLIGSLKKEYHLE